MVHVRITIAREPETHAPGRPPVVAPPRRWRRLVGLASALTVVAVALVAGAGAAPTTDTTAVAFVDIPAKQVWGSNAISPQKAESVVVIGGTSTVPSNATTVRLEVTVKGAADGTLRFYPAGNEGGGAGHSLSWVAGASSTGTTAENVGLQNKVSVFNDSTKAATVKVRITGYSTQVTAGDINGSGGSVGNVLTNDGSGGAAWADLPDDAYLTAAPIPANLGGTAVNVATLAVPNGSYMVMYTGEFENSSGVVNTVQCQLTSPTGATLARTRQTAANLHSGSVALVGIVNTDGGTVRVVCWSLQGAAGRIFNGSLVAAQVGAAHTVPSSASQPRRRS